MLLSVLVLVQVGLKVHVCVLYKGGIASCNMSSKAMPNNYLRPRVYDFLTIEDLQASVNNVVHMFALDLRQRVHVPFSCEHFSMLKPANTTSVLRSHLCCQCLAMIARSESHIYVHTYIYTYICTYTHIHSEVL